MLFGTLVVIHILVSIFLVLVVLLQAGKGGGMGVAFGGGGGGGSVLGAGGATTFLGKATVAAGATFMVTSMTLAYLSSTSRSVVAESVLDNEASIVAEEDKKAEDAEAGDAKAGDTKAGDAKAGDAKAGDEKAGTGRTLEDIKKALPGADIKENPDGTGTVEFNLDDANKAGKLELPAGGDKAAEKPAGDAAPKGEEKNP
jgi:protein translocase SecG subunit